ncbi:MAG: tryptophan--tRNA ligase [Candidatus Palauibacterales bacterium]|nr:tryptophan--tRNA ligase [Candidatus Palauibacterales bacterium]MDP2482844.1 tryptophan--tRNA ligase [Candidatus Palauibacterales bacterium]
MTQGKSRVFSGIQPSGELHIGNYLGAIRNWVALTEEYECIYCIVDLHAVTVPYEPAELPGRIRELAIGLLASGVDPERCTLFVQSAVPEHTELAWLLNTVTPLGELSRMTQFKDKSDRVDTVNAGLLNYPVLQAADILLYLADRVPVGEDQVQHLELTREIARRWNGRFGDYFPEPQALTGGGKRILGLDGMSKMSKSQNNTIPLLADEEDLWSVLRMAVTDPARVRREDPGNPDVCNVFTLHGHFSSTEERAEIDVLCRTAGIGCVDCKRRLTANMAEHLAPIRDSAEDLRANPDRVTEILDEGARRARAIASVTVAEVRDRMGIARRSP